jgi:ankyrin repeat protein
MGPLKIIALIGVVTLIACDPGPLPDVPERHPDSRQDRFPSESYEPLPLGVAIQRGTLEDVRRLLNQGANPNARWLDGERFPLQEVLESPAYGYRLNEPVEATRLLLQHGADPNAKWCPFESRGPAYDGGPSCTTDTAVTPLMFATFWGAREIVQMLLEAGADPTPRDWGGASALDYAYDEVIFEMISRAQFPDLRTRDAQSLEWVSSNEGSPFDNSLWRELPITRALTQQEGVVFPGPPPPPPHSNLLFGIERETRVVNRLRTLLRIGADPDQRLTLAGVDSTPLSLALRANQLRSARVLLEHGSDVNLRWCTQYEVRDYKQIPTQPPGCTSSNGMTPLMWAASTNRREAVELLLEFKADRLLRDWTGRSALEYAQEPGVRELLSERR